MKFIVAPSIFSSDFFRLSEEISKVESIKDSWLHIDIMDGNFVPQISFGSAITKTIRKHTDKVIDVHLMVKNLEREIELFSETGANYITFHSEETHFPLRMIKKIKSYGIKAGISINPFTKLDYVDFILPYIDLLLIMSVEPGFSGQKFITETKNKIEKAKFIRRDKGLNFLISVDGGVCEENALQIIEAGADILVMGSYFFKNNFEEIKTFIETLRKKLTK